MISEALGRIEITHHDFFLSFFSNECRNGEHPSRRNNTFVVLGYTSLFFLHDLKLNFRIYSHFYFYVFLFSMYGHLFFYKEKRKKGKTNSFT